MLPEHACVFVTDYIAHCWQCLLNGRAGDWCSCKLVCIRLTFNVSNRRTFRGTQVQRPGAIEKRRPLSLAAFWKVPASVS